MVPSPSLWYFVLLSACFLQWLERIGVENDGKEMVGGVFCAGKTSSYNRTRQPASSGHQRFVPNSFYFESQIRVNNHGKSIEGS